jgi:serine/threonine protein kinase
VKPSNILLDDNLDAKVSDFGISRETPEFITHVSTQLAGTAGYIDPQYFLRRQLTPASDVYSYGVVLLELVTGQKAIRKNEQGDELNLIQWATPRLEKGGIEAIVDAQLEGNYPQNIYLDMAQLAVRCAAFEKDFRPSMKVAH